MSDDTNIDPRVRARMSKLLELARRGVGGVMMWAGHIGGVGSLLVGALLPFLGAMVTGAR